MEDEPKPSELTALVRKRIKDLMDRRGWKQKDLAAAVGRGQPWASLALSEADARGFPLTTVEEIAKAFRVPVVDLLQEPQPPPA